MSENKVTLDSKLTVVSSRPMKPGMIHKLSGVDHGMGYHSLHLIFYYKNEDKWFESFELDPLRGSLSEVLSMYPTVTGRLALVEEDGGDWEIRCNDTGVRVIKANVDSTIEKWLSSSAGASDEVQLIAWDDMPLDTSIWSPFQIQINSFKEGGIAIGVSCTHMIADLTFLSSFFKSWSQIYRLTPISHPPFLTPIPITSSPSNNNTSPNSGPKPQTNITSATFKFSSSIIKQLTSKCPGATAFDVLAALFWTRVTLLKPSKLYKQNHSLSICIDFRKLIKPSLPVGYFGNALYFSKFSLNSEEMKNGKKLQDIASLIHMHTKDVTEKEIMSFIESFESQEESTLKCVYGSSELTCVNMEEEETESLLYESIFGDNEKPAHVSCRVGNVGGEGLIMVMPSSEGEFARNVIVMLKEEEVDKLCKDEEMLKLQPTVILC
ncbi:unnamed protein product [Lathyrus sativus]|nr:unnamed protein product [Lathyrus sativus]